MKEIICGKCHQANPGSSKFCNHCGNPLPPPDSIICPNCHASNPTKTYYCDECGTRLVTDKLGSGALPPEEQAVDKPSDFFSLPVRKPGDIAEFDPADLSNWLEDESGDSPLMPVEGTGALGTGGLPDWLINESNPILNIPKEITTEHYNLLIDTDENLPVLPPQVDVNLPDWLTDVAADTVDDAADDTPTGTAVPDWMPPPESDQDSPKISGTTVADLSESETASEFDFEDLFDFDDPEPTTGEPSAAEIAIDDDDWLNELIDDDGSSMFAEETAVSPAASTAGTDFTIDEDDWLNVLMDEGAALDAEETAVSPPNLAADTNEFADWLADDAAVEAAPEIDDDAWLDVLNDEGGSDEFVEETAVVPDPSPDVPVATPDTAVDENDWLADLGEGGTELFDSSMPSDGEASLDWLDDDAATSGGDFDEELDDLFAGTELIGDDGLDWLDVEEETSSDTAAVEDMFAAGAAALAVDGTGNLWLDDADDAEVEDEPDWLAEYATESLAPIGEEELPAVEEPFEPAPLADIDDDLEEFFSSSDDVGAGAEDFFSSSDDVDDGVEDFFSSSDDTIDDLFGDAATFTAADSIASVSDEFSLETTEQDLSFAAEMLGSDGSDDEFSWVGDSTADVDDDLPDWLDDLGEADDAIEEPDIEAETAVPAVAIANEVPAWLADMAPGTTESEGGLSLTDSSAALADVADDFDSITFDDDELSGVGLPEWLHEDATGDDSTLSPSVAAGLAVAGTVFSDGDIIDDLLDGTDDFAGIDLSDLPPSIPLEERLAKARVPDWIQELKPAELTPEGSEPEPEPIPESAGPLVGIGGVIALQSALSPLYDASAPVNRFAVTKEHQQQTALLRQLTHGERKLSSGMTQSDAKTSARVRMALIIALLLVALGGLFGPSLVSLPTEPSPALMAVHDELTAVSNQPVLIAFEYTPAMAGELNAQAETLLATLAENGSSAIVVSQSAAGSTIAASYLPEDGMQIGMVTGGAVGLRQLADCVGKTAVCTTLLGREVTPDEQAMLRDVALIIVLTGERDSMVNWIEQVGTPSGLPVVAGLTASIAPLAAPYYDSGQIGGMMVGLQETAVYQQTWQTQADDNILSRLNAQALLQLAAALLLVAGGLYYGMLEAKKNKKVGN